MPTTNIKWRPLCAPGVTKNVIIASSADGTLKHWHTTSGRLLNTTFNEDHKVKTCDYKPDGTAFLTADDDFIIRVYDEQTRQLKTEMTGGLNEQIHSNRIMCAKFDKEDENLIISGGWDQNVKIWDIRQSGSVRTFVGPMITGDAIDIHDGYILTGSYSPENQLQLWDFNTCEHIEDIPWDEALPVDQSCLVYSCQFQKSTGDLIIAGGSGNNEVRIFDGNALFRPCASICELSRAVFSVDFSNSGDMFAMGGGDGVVRVFNVVNEV